MTTFIWIILATFFISAISFIGALGLFLKERILDKILLLLVAFSAGALFGGAFLHLIPESIEAIGLGENSILEIFLYLIIGFCTFFILEQFIKWHHHHSMQHPKIMPFSYLILISDGIHNFIDGIVVAASFAVSLPTGLVTALAVGLHEIPQEIGDFGILIYGGFKKIKALFLNFISASTIILGGIVGFLIAEKISDKIIFLLPFAAGNFIYIAASDLIPHIKEEKDFKKSILNFLTFLFGVIIMFLFKIYLDE